MNYSKFYNYDMIFLKYCLPTASYLEGYYVDRLHLTDL